VKQTCKSGCLFDQGTLDGRHYTLIQQGNFLLWGFSGLFLPLVLMSLRTADFSEDVKMLLF
jgi:hypothetical protein